MERSLNTERSRLIDMDGERIHILLVEDEEAHSELIRRAFQPRGENVRFTVAGSLQAARACLAESPPDLVIADLLLPDGKSIELLPQSGEAPTFPFILMTSHGDEYVAVEAMRAGALDYVTKSETTLSDMPRVTDRALREWNHIAERRLGEEEKKRLEEQLRQSQKMEAVGQLAGGIAHDFNNLLQAILGYTELGLADIPSEESLRQDFEQIQKAAERAATLTRQLLAFSRRQLLRPVDVALNEIITDLSKILLRVIGEHIELKLNLGRALPFIHADTGTLEQVLMNLCVNARDAMPDGGELTLATQEAHIDAQTALDHHWATEGHYVQLSVTDSGIGMQSDVLERVFEPFFTTKEAGKGTGLGLAMVYGIVRQQDGLVRVRSQPGHGTTFDIYLPIVENALKVDEENGTDRTTARGTETLLLAEDEEIVLTLASRVLKENGYTVLTARDGEEAVRVFEANADTITLAVLDVVMPKMSGRGVHDRIKAMRPDIQVLFSSGYNTDAVHSRFVAEEGLQIIQKPYAPTDLLRKVREILDTEPASTS